MLHLVEGPVVPRLVRLAYERYEDTVQRQREQHQRWLKENQGHTGQTNESADAARSRKREMK